MLTLKQIEAAEVGHIVACGCSPECDIIFIKFNHDLWRAFRWNNNDTFTLIETGQVELNSSVLLFDVDDGR